MRKWIIVSDILTRWHLTLGHVVAIMVTAGPEVGPPSQPTHPNPNGVKIRLIRLANHWPNIILMCPRRQLCSGFLPCPPLTHLAKVFWYYSRFIPTIWCIHSWLCLIHCCQHYTCVRRIAFKFYWCDKLSTRCCLLNFSCWISINLASNNVLNIPLFWGLWKWKEWHWIDGKI